MLFQNEFIDVYVKEDVVFIRPKKNGFPLKSFDEITQKYPRLKIKSFTALQKAMNDIGVEQNIGNWLPIVEITVSQDKMTAQIVVNASLDDIEEKRKEILSAIENVIAQKAIVFGQRDFRNETMVPGKPITIATGKEPVKGADAIITYIDRPERKPVIRDDGSANYYEMNFVYPVDEGEWLGEKIPAQEGIEGIDIFGNPIAASKGKDENLRYDRKSVVEVMENDKIVLRAIHGGTLEFINDMVSIGKQLVIKGDVGPETGSITFDGTVLIYGTVLDGYSVTATGDISIEGKEGVTNAKIIQSSDGDIFIKGGVFGAGSTIIEAKGNIYLKHANNCKLYGKEIHVGFYLLGSEVIAENVLVEKSKGKIIGGTIESLFTIECAIAGNVHERKTVLIAKGIHTDILFAEIQKLAKDLKERQEVATKLEQHIEQFEKVATDLKGHQAESFEKMKESLEATQNSIKEMDFEIQLKLSLMKSAVPPEIKVTKEAFPGTTIQIGNKTSTLYQTTNGVFKLENGVLNV